MSDNYTEETSPLFKLLRTEAFRFVIVRYNHFSFVQQLENDLQHIFPDRPLIKIDAENADYQSIIKAYFSINRGFFFLLNFADVLKEQFDSLNKETPQLKVENERRRGITAGLNLRRDKLAQNPVALFVFVPASTGELYAKHIMEKMPDLWSFRSIILDLERAGSIESDLLPAEKNIEIIQTAESVTGDEKELNRLLALFTNISESETALRLTLFPQIIEAAIDAGKYDTALIYLNDWELLTDEKDKFTVLSDKGDVFKLQGKLHEALLCYEKAKELAEKNDDDFNKALINQRLGSLKADFGDLKMSLVYFEEYNRQFKNIFDKYHQNQIFKNGLAISYEKLGEAHSALGNLDKALTFFEDETILFKELYEVFPQNVSFKNGLAISYERLGSTHSALGNLDKALTFFEDETILFKELCEAFPQNISFKNGLAISYSKLGETHFALGNLDKALTFFEKDIELTKELYEAFPQNVSFKNGLAVSFFKLGEFHLQKLNDNIKARFYFAESKSLLQDLVKDAPSYAKFKADLEEVNNELEKLT